MGIRDIAEKAFSAGDYIFFFGSAGNPTYSQIKQVEITHWHSSGDNTYSIMYTVAGNECHDERKRISHDAAFATEEEVLAHLIAKVYKLKGGK